MEQRHISSDCLQAVKAIKAAILKSQYRAAKSVNREQLALYFSIIYVLQRTERIMQEIDNVMHK